MVWGVPTVAPALVMVTVAETALRLNTESTKLLLKAVFSWSFIVVTAKYSHPR